MRHRASSTLAGLTVLLLAACAAPRTLSAGARFQDEPPSEPSPLPLAPRAELERPLEHVSLFLGENVRGDFSGFTAGLDYQHRIDPKVAAGGFAYRSVGDAERWVVAPAVYFHPWAGLEIQFGAGLAFLPGNTCIALRAALAYRFELPAGVTLGPQVAYDEISGGENTFLYGLALGYRW